jgi:hypothetical protein
VFGKRSLGDPAIRICREERGDAQLPAIDGINGWGRLGC